MKKVKIFSITTLSLIVLWQALFSKNKQVEVELESPSSESAVSAFDENEYHRLPVKIQESAAKKERASFEFNDLIKFNERRLFLQLDENGNVIDNKDKEEKIDLDKQIDDAKNKLAKLVAQVAQDFLEKNITRVKIGSSEVRIDTDCSHFVRAAYYRASNEKIDLFHDAFASKAISGNVSSGVEILYRYTKNKFRYSNQKAQIGDIIIFDNTFDKNNNRKRDDLYTHTGIVVKVRDDDTVEFVHGNASKTIKYGYLNLKTPAVVSKDGKQYNSYLRARYSWDKNPAVLTGQLTNGFGGF